MTDKRQIVPTKLTIAVSDGSGEIETGVIIGTIRRIVVKGPPGPAPVGRVKLRDEDESLDIFQESEPGTAEIDLKFFQFSLDIPVNGPYKWSIEDASRDGNYTLYYILEERPRVI